MDETLLTVMMVMALVSWLIPVAYKYDKDAIGIAALVNLAAAITALQMIIG